MWKTLSKITVATLGCLLVLGTGCRREAGKVPDYDRLPAMQMRDLFRAIADGDHELAIRKLERIVEISPESPGIYGLLRLLVEDVAVEEANAKLTEHDLDGALDRLRLSRMQHGSSPRLDREIKMLEGLQTMQAYVKREDYPSGQALAQAVAELPEPSLYEPLPMYAEWHAQQRRRAALRLEEDKRHAIAKLVDQLDLALVCSKPPAELLESLRALDAKHPVLAAWERSTSKTFNEKMAGDSLSAAEREVAMLCYYRRGPTNDQKLLETLAVHDEPQTRSGRYLKAIGLWQTGKRVRALVEMKVLSEVAPGLDTSALDKLVVEAIKVEGQKTSLSVPGFLDAWQAMMAEPASK